MTNNSISTNSAPTFSNWNTNYHSALTARTKEAAFKSIKRHVVRYIGEKTLNEVTPVDISKIYATMRNKGLSESTIVVLDNQLYRMFDVAVEKKYITKNPIDQIVRPVYIPKDVCPLTDEEWDTIKKVVKTSIFSNLYSLVLEIGIRPGEALALTWEDIDFHQNLIRVHQVVQNFVTSPSFKDITEKAVMYELTSDAVSALKAEKKSQEKKKVLAADRWNNTGNLVFTNAYGYPIQHSMLSAEGKNIKKRTRINDFSINRLSSECRFRKNSFHSEEKEAV